MFDGFEAMHQLIRSASTPGLFKHFPYEIKSQDDDIMILEFLQLYNNQNKIILIVNKNLLNIKVDINHDIEFIMLLNDFSFLFLQANLKDSPAQ